MRSLDVCGSVPLSAAPVELAVAAEFELDELEGADDESEDAELDELEAFVAEPESAVAGELVELESAVLVAVSLAGVSGANAVIDEDSALEPDSLVLATEPPVVLSESDRALELALVSDDSLLALVDSALELVLESLVL